MSGPEGKAPGGPGEAPGATRRPGRDPATVRREGNHLKGEGSLYLRQHAANPVDWRPWGDEALALARELDVPIFASIGYASCHWCHVMEREAFDDDAIAAFLNAHFVCVKVDREERPDVDAACMDAVQAMTGSGGWPLSVFLTPAIRPFFGGTYFPPPEFARLLERLDFLWRTRRADVEAQGSRVREAVADGLSSLGRTALDPADAEAAAAGAATLFDPRWGGLAGRMKFPQVPLLDLLLHRWRAGRDPGILQALRATLGGMASGGLRDHVGGGFHRYAVEPTWTVPHFEKMLYDNAQLARLFTEAAVATADEGLAAVARDTLEFLLEAMQGGDGLFHASLDADSGGEEGTFYLWTPRELRELAGAEGDDLARLLGVTEGGNFEGRSIPTRRGDPREGDEALWARWRPALRAARALRTPPPLDRKAVLEWNAMAVTALAEASGALGEDRYRAAAERAADRLREVHRRPDGTWARASNDGRPTGQAVLQDHAQWALALLALHGATGRAHHLRRALEVAGQARDRFARDGGGFYRTADGTDAPLARAADAFDHATPSGNGAMARLCARLAALTGDPAWAAARDGLLEALSGLLARSAVDAPWTLDVLADRDRLLSVVVAADPGDPEGDRMMRAAGALASSRVVVARVPAAGADADLLQAAPALAGKAAAGGRATAWVCRQGACLAPVHDGRALHDALAGLLGPGAD